MRSFPPYFVVSLFVPLILWFFLFSPWTSGAIDFWIGITVAAAILLGTVFCLSPSWYKDVRVSVVDTILGAGLAAALWSVFWLGDWVSAAILPFTVLQVDTIYTLKDGINPWLVGAALLLLIGPAEEIFWRGYVQRTFSERWNPNIGFVCMLVLYSLEHVWSGNFMLIMAALVAGGFQGLVYRFFPKRLWALIVSHALWDCAVFLVFPI